MAFANGFHADDAVRKEIDATQRPGFERGPWTHRPYRPKGGLFSFHGTFARLGGVLEFEFLQWPVLVYWSVLPCADGLVLDSRNVPGSCRLAFIIGSDPKVSVAERPVVLPRQPKRRATCLSLAFLLHQRASRHICLVRCVMT
jgi:hypothetical protein